MAGSQDSAPRAAASVILLREGPSGVEVYLVRRHRKASFMSSAYVFPGGVAEPGEGDARVTAGRELFEEAGVLLSGCETSAAQRQAWRRALNIEKRSFFDLASEAQIECSALQYYSEWITPSVEARRYRAQFFIALMPEGQVASPDNAETVDEVWLSPEEALARSTELALPPPQLRTFYELLEPAKNGVGAVFEYARLGANRPHAILPRACASEAGLTLLLPWDEDYESAGEGESLPMPPGHPQAWGASRFILRNNGGWEHR